MITSAQPSQSDYNTLLNLIARLPIQERLRLISEVSARLSTEVMEKKMKRGLRELYGAWRGAIFDEDDFKTAEWTPPDDF